jgi:hypothetical protein
MVKVVCRSEQAARSAAARTSSSGCRVREDRHPAALRACCEPTSAGVLCRECNAVEARPAPVHGERSRSSCRTACRHSVDVWAAAWSCHRYRSARSVVTTHRSWLICRAYVVQYSICSGQPRRRRRAAASCARSWCACGAQPASSQSALRLQAHILRIPSHIQSTQPSVHSSAPPVSAPSRADSPFSVQRVQRLRRGHTSVAGHG